MTITDFRNSRGLLIDANLLTLLVIGELDIGLVEKHNRTSAYILGDYHLLLHIMSIFKCVVVTPNILTEVSNLVEGTSYKGISALSVLKKFTILAKEEFVSSIDVMNNDSTSYLKFGLSDAVIHSIAKTNYTVLTQDLKLWAYLQGLGLLAINFNQLRTENLLK